MFAGYFSISEAQFSTTDTGALSVVSIFELTRNFWPPAPFLGCHCSGRAICDPAYVEFWIRAQSPLGLELRCAPSRTTDARAER